MIAFWEFGNIGPFLSASFPFNFSFFSTNHCNGGRAAAWQPLTQPRASPARAKLRGFASPISEGDWLRQLFELARTRFKELSERSERSVLRARSARALRRRGAEGTGFASRSSPPKEEVSEGNRPPKEAFFEEEGLRSKPERSEVFRRKTAAASSLLLAERSVKERGRGAKLRVRATKLRELAPEAMHPSGASFLRKLQHNCLRNCSRNENNWAVFRRKTIVLRTMFGFAEPFFEEEHHEWGRSAATDE